MTQFLFFLSLVMSCFAQAASQKNEEFQLLGSATVYSNGKTVVEIPASDGTVEKIVTEGAQSHPKMLFDKKRSLLLDGEGIPFTGVERSYHSNGQLKSEIPYAKGKPNGIAKKYRENGLIYEEYPVENGIINGDARQYDYDYGFLRGKIPYKKGQKSGVAEEYDICGNITMTMPFKNGQVTGIVKEYYEDGTLQRETTIENGKTNGIVKEYSSDGGLIRETVYKDGKKVSSKDSSTTYSRGQTIQKAIYRDGKKYTVNVSTIDLPKKKSSLEDGSKEFYPNGQLKREFHHEGTGTDRKFYDKWYYKNGSVRIESVSFSGSEKDGFSKEFYPNGQLKSEAHFDKGTGFEKQYFPNGKLRMETPYKADKKEGIEQEYFMDGSLKRETPYVNNKREGWEKVYYYATGIVWKKDLYKEGDSQKYEYYRVDGELNTMPPISTDEYRSYIQKLHEKFYEKTDSETVVSK